MEARFFKSKTMHRSKILQIKDNAWKQDSSNQRQYMGARFFKSKTMHGSQITQIKDNA